jgi:hypothetical protein
VDRIDIFSITRFSLSISSRHPFDFWTYDRIARDTTTTKVLALQIGELGSPLLQEQLHYQKMFHVNDKEPCTLRTHPGLHGSTRQVDKGMDGSMHHTTTTITTTGACVQWVSGRSTQDNMKHASGSDKHRRRIDQWLALLDSGSLPSA